ncbi:hypothetical protein F2P81_022815 [Scophthalmus maximus]|uniref:Uncharacterized protein n=1 Tax=Scophthalmus maximus TaxID=52904 RepID=A0A6A4S5W3_SCOMX|nr:hypothetical protein F2P81_022815 [Scophthalmus maximus]
MDETVSDCRRLQFEQTELSVSFLLILHVCKFPGSTILNVTFIVFSDSVGLLVFLVGRRQNNRSDIVSGTSSRVKVQRDAIAAPVLQQRATGDQRAERSNDSETLVRREDVELRRQHREPDRSGSVQMVRMVRIGPEGPDGPDGPEGPEGPDGPDRSGSVRIRPEGPDAASETSQPMTEDDSSHRPMSSQQSCEGQSTDTTQDETRLMF